MNGWADRFPVVSPPEAAASKRVTLVLPYYENPAFLQEQIASWNAWGDDLRPSIDVIVVDDGSPEPAVVPSASGARLFRIAPDVPWNWLAARNIGAHYATTDWLLLTDMDHLVPPDTARAVVTGDHDPSVIYAFSRREHTGATIPPHSASFLMTRALFWTIGGYDETLSGHYGTDGDWRRRCAAVASFRVLTDALVRHEYVGDSSTTRYQRKTAADREAVTRLVAARRPGWRPKVLTFEHREVFA